MWRETCGEAGLTFIVDNCTGNGARKIAARYLDTGILTPETVKQAMRRLAHLITHNERAQHYTLNALGNNISRYIESRKTLSGSAEPRRALWDFVCHDCGTTAAGYYPVDAPPRPVACTRHGCHGIMIPKKG